MRLSVGAAHLDRHSGSLETERLRPESFNFDRSSSKSGGSTIIARAPATAVAGRSEKSYGGVRLRACTKPPDAR